ncbi:MAG TPA: hypothetical protein ENK93_03545 [Campylobacteraceae bacterium]|nr:hypothetical protein [Campylobacteraceae bacterium]
MQIRETNPQFNMQYSSLEIAISHARQTQKGGGFSESISLDIRFTEFTLQSGDFHKRNTHAHGALMTMVEGNQDIKDFLMGLEHEGMLSLKDLGYEGKPILKLSPEEASSLIADGGFFSVENTAKRGADFVLSGAGDDLEMLKAGREGIVKGFEEAEKLWGGKLPDIAYETQKRTLEMIDEKIRSLGANALDLAA